MKYAPIAVLGLILAFSLWNSSAQTNDTARWQAQLDQADTLAQSEEWSAVTAVLEASHKDWSQCQTYLHIVSHHSAVDEAEVLYRRCLSFAETQEVTEFRAELAALRHQLGLLAEMEQFTIKNVL